MKSAAMMLLVAFASGPSAQCDPGKMVCPMIRLHTPEFVEQLEKEESDLDRDSAIWQTLTDYRELRGGIRRLCSST